MKKPKKHAFKHEENAEFHRNQATIVFEYIQYLKEQQTIEPMMFKHTRKELICALYDVMFAANRQMNYRDWLQSRREVEKERKENQSFMQRLFGKK